MFRPGEPPRRARVLIFHGRIDRQALRVELLILPGEGSKRVRKLLIASLLRLEYGNWSRQLMALGKVVETTNNQKQGSDVFDRRRDVLGRRLSGCQYQRSQGQTWLPRAARLTRPKADHLANFGKSVVGLGAIGNATCTEQAVLLSEENANAGQDTPAREFDV